MEVDQQIVKSAIKFLGIVFMVCGGLLFVFNLLLIPPGAILYFFPIIPDLIIPTLILSVGIALNMISKAF